jgi:gluconate 5-dehydrogenase
MVDKVLAEFGKIDVLITAAGIATVTRPRTSPGCLREGLDGQRHRHVHHCKLVGKQMIKQGFGKIVTVGSVRGEMGHPGGYAAYGTTKGAVHLPTQAAVDEWAKYHINVNCIAPCIFWTPSRSRCSRTRNSSRSSCRASVGPCGRAR